MKNSVACAEKTEPNIIQMMLDADCRRGIYLSCNRNVASEHCYILAEIPAFQTAVKICCVTGNKTIHHNVIMI